MMDSKYLQHLFVWMFYVIMLTGGDVVYIASGKESHKQSGARLVVRCHVYTTATQHNPMSD